MRKIKLGQLAVHMGCKGEESVGLYFKITTKMNSNFQLR